MPWRDVAEGTQALAEGGLARQGALDRDGRKEPVLGGGCGEQGEACEEADVGAADRIDRANAGGRAAKRCKDAPSGAALLGEPCGLRRTSRGDEVRGAQWQEGGEAAKATRPGGRQSACAQGSDVRRDGVPRDNTGTRLAGAVEAVDRLLSQEPSREGGRCQPFFVERPSSASTCPTSLALTVHPMGVQVSAISSRVPLVSKRVRMRSASISLVRCDGVCGPVRLGKRSAAVPWRTALRLS